MDKLNRPYNNAKQTLKNMRDIEEIINKLDIDTIENANNILDPLDGKYKSIKDFSVEYFGGATTEAILRWIAQKNQTYSLTHNYSKGEFTLYVNPDDKTGLTVISKVNNNVGNLPPKTPNSENDFWYSLASVPFPIDEIVDALKPFVSQEIARQLPDAVIKFANDNPAFSKDLILLANGDAGVEHFKTTYNVPDANVEVSDFGDATFKSGEKVKNVDYLGTSNKTSITKLENNKQDKDVWSNIKLTLSGNKLIPGVTLNSFKKLFFSWYGKNTSGWEYYVNIEINNAELFDFNDNDWFIEYYTFADSHSHHQQKVVIKNASIELLKGITDSTWDGSGKWVANTYSEFILKSSKGVWK